MIGFFCLCKISGFILACLHSFCSFAVNFITPFPLLLLYPLRASSCFVIAVTCSITIPSYYFLLHCHVQCISSVSVTCHFVSSSRLAFPLFAIPHLLRICPVVCIHHKDGLSCDISSCWHSCSLLPSRSGILQKLRPPWWEPRAIKLRFPVFKPGVRNTALHS